MSVRQIVVLIGLGGLFWLLAALAIRSVGPALLDGDVVNGLLFVGFIPVAFILVFASGRFANLDQKNLVEGIAVMVATATLLDGVALTWWPDFYGHTAHLRERAGAALLWGAGATIASSILLSRS